MNALSLFGQTSDYYNYSYSYGTSPDPGTTTISPMAFVVIMLITLVFVAALYVVHAYFLSRIFKKAGVEAWKAWVPVYNTWVTLELGGQQGFWAVLAFIPLVNIAAAVFMFIAMYHIGLHLGKEGAFVLFAIFLPLVWEIWLAVDHSTWDNAVPGSPAAQPVATAPQQPSSETPTSNDPPATPPAAQ